MGFDAAWPPLVRCKEIDKTLAELFKENEEGVNNCRTVLLQKQINTGEYQVSESPCNLKDLLMSTCSGANVDVEVSPSIPDWIWLDTFLARLIISNAYSNSVMHGPAAGGPIKISVMEIEEQGRSVSQSHFCIEMNNQPGPKHMENLLEQARRGNNHLMNSKSAQEKSNLVPLIGSNASTMLGTSEISVVAKLMGARANLSFDETLVTFSLEFPAHTATAPSEMTLPEGTIFVCADDDLAARSGYKGLLRKPGLNADPALSKILGATYAEVSDLVQQICELHYKHSERTLVVIVDQNMDKYSEGHVYGTNVVKELRCMGLQVPVFIRSANDDFDSLEKYRNAGATGSLSKKGNVDTLAEDIQVQYFNSQRASRLPPVAEPIEALKPLPSRICIL